MKEKNAQLVLVHLLFKVIIIIYVFCRQKTRRKPIQTDNLESIFLQNIKNTTSSNDILIVVVFILLYDVYNLHAAHLCSMQL